MAGTVEKGVRYDFRKLGIKTPRTTLQNIAIRLAILLDTPGIDETKIIGASRELRLTMEKMGVKPGEAQDNITLLLDRVNKKTDGNVPAQSQSD